MASQRIDRASVPRQVLNLLDDTARKKLAGLFVLMLFGAGLEAVGVGVVLPFLDLLSNPDAVTTNEFLAPVHAWLGAPEPRLMLMWSAGLLFALFAVKNLFLAGMHWYKFKFNYDEQVNLSTRMFDLYLRTPYLYHLDRNSSELLRNVTEEVRKVFAHVVLAGLGLLVEVFVALALVALLVAVEPVIAPLVVGVFLAVGGGFFLFIRRKAQRLGEEQVEHAGLMIRWVNQGFGSLKETKIRGCEDYFLRRFETSNAAYAHAMQYHQFVRQLPIHVVETLGLGTMMLLVVALLARGSELAAILPTVGLFAMAAVRMMPSATRMISALTSIKLFLPSLQALSDDYEELTAVAKQGAKGRGNEEIRLQHAIELDGVTFRYPNADNVTLDAIDMRIPRGTSVALVGTSGAGKTTLVDVILGLLDLESGQVLVDGQNIQEGRDSWQRDIGYISQPVYLMDDTIRANVALGVEAQDIDDEQVWRALEAAQLADFVRGELPAGLDTVIGEHGTRFSGGQRQRVGIARALYPDPSVLVLDEATSALDSETEAELTRAVNALRGARTIIVIAHRFSTIRECDQIHMLKHGKVVASGTYDELLSSDLEFRRLAGTQVERAAGE